MNIREREWNTVNQKIVAIVVIRWSRNLSTPSDSIFFLLKIFRRFYIFHKPPFIGKTYYPFASNDLVPSESNYPGRESIADRNA